MREGASTIAPGELRVPERNLPLDPEQEVNDLRAIPLFRPSGRAASLSLPEVNLGIEAVNRERPQIPGRTT
jgi:hypothetical protein